MTPRSLGLQILVSLRALLVLTVILGVVYPVAVTSAAQVTMPDRANGSLLRVDGQLVGSSLLAQDTSDSSGHPLPRYFQPRPSAAGERGYDAAASSGSNLGPESEELVQLIRERRVAVARFNGVRADEVPADALTASSSGLDPEISPEYARLQSRRVASARGLDEETVRRLVQEHTAGRDLGFLGEPRVNVMELNAALDRLGR